MRSDGFQLADADVEEALDARLLRGLPHELAFRQFDPIQPRQFVKDGAVYLGDRKISDISYKLREEDFGPDGRVLLKVGNKKRGILNRKPE